MLGNVLSKADKVRPPLKAAMAGAWRAPFSLSEADDGVY